MKAGRILLGQTSYWVKKNVHQTVVMLLTYVLCIVSFQVDVESLAYTSKLSISSRREQKGQMVRPLSRKDIFYSGSIVNLPEYHKSQKSLTNYRQSILSIPQIKNAEDEGTRKCVYIEFTKIAQFEQKRIVNSLQKKN